MDSNIGAISYLKKINKNLKLNYSESYLNADLKKSGYKKYLEYLNSALQMPESIIKLGFKNISSQLNIENTTYVSNSSINLLWDLKKINILKNKKDNQVISYWYLLNGANNLTDYTKKYKISFILDLKNIKIKNSLSIGKISTTLLEKNKHTALFLAKMRGDCLLSKKNYSKLSDFKIKKWPIFGNYKKLVFYKQVRGGLLGYKKNKTLKKFIDFQVACYGNKNIGIAIGNKTNEIKEHLMLSKTSRVFLGFHKKWKYSDIINYKKTKIKNITLLGLLKEKDILSHFKNKTITNFLSIPLILNPNNIFLSLIKNKYKKINTIISYRANYTISPKYKKNIPNMGNIFISDDFWYKMWVAKSSNRKLKNIPFETLCEFKNIKIFEYAKNKEYYLYFRQILDFSNNKKKYKKYQYFNNSNLTNFGHICNTYSLNNKKINKVFFLNLKLTHLGNLPIKLKNLEIFKKILFKRSVNLNFLHNIISERVSKKLILLTDRNISLDRSLKKTSLILNFSNNRKSQFLDKTVSFITKNYKSNYDYIVLDFKKINLLRKIQNSKAISYLYYFNTKNTNKVLGGYINNNGSLVLSELKSEKSKIENSLNSLFSKTHSMVSSKMPDAAGIDFFKNIRRYSGILKRNLYRNYKTTRYQNIKKLNLYKKYNKYLGFKFSDLELVNFTSNKKIAKLSNIYSKLIKIINSNKLLSSNISNSTINSLLKPNNNSNLNSASNLALFSKYFEILNSMGTIKGTLFKKNLVNFNVNKKLTSFLLSKYTIGLKAGSSLNFKKNLIKKLNELDTNITVARLINITNKKFLFLTNLRDRVSRYKFLTYLDFIMKINKNLNIKNSKIVTLLIADKYVELFSGSLSNMKYLRRLAWEMKTVWWFIEKIERRLSELSYIENLWLLKKNNSIANLDYKIRQKESFEISKLTNLMTLLADYSLKIKNITNSQSNPSINNYKLAVNNYILNLNLKISDIKTKTKTLLNFHQKIQNLYIKKNLSNLSKNLAISSLLGVLYLEKDKIVWFKTNNCEISNSGLYSSILSEKLGWCGKSTTEKITNKLVSNFINLRASYIKKIKIEKYILSLDYIIGHFKKITKSAPYSNKSILENYYISSYYYNFNLKNFVKFYKFLNILGIFLTNDNIKKVINTNNGLFCFSFYKKYKNLELKINIKNKEFVSSHKMKYFFKNIKNNTDRVFLNSWISDYLVVNRRLNIFLNEWNSKKVQVRDFWFRTNSVYSPESDILKKSYKSWKENNIGRLSGKLGNFGTLWLEKNKKIIDNYRKNLGIVDISVNSRMVRNSSKIYRKYAKKINHFTNFKINKSRLFSIYGISKNLGMIKDSFSYENIKNLLLKKKKLIILGTNLYSQLKNYQPKTLRKVIFGNRLFKFHYNILGLKKKTILA